ncbi:MAG: hypothetical protein HUJ16_05415 [Kangiella sp.]|uniref:Uncharacterized protein n=1 Tax=Kangiella aquimarina TaxID=261965 RepID=A0ABZ0X7C6_9GAMM|nr:hypothetical protein [Kangiella aquimarina]MBD3667376.1 hypothetical protein [Kangiella sp.]WQG86244.1 hypothetical protein SR900_04965 [Kangiella aquimarina]
MKYILVIVAALAGIKFLADTPYFAQLFAENKELFVAFALTIASKPLLKKIFE